MYKRNDPFSTVFRISTCFYFFIFASFLLLRCCWLSLKKKCFSLERTRMKPSWFFSEANHIVSNIASIPVWYAVRAHTMSILTFTWRKEFTFFFVLMRQQNWKKSNGILPFFHLSDFIKTLIYESYDQLTLLYHWCGIEWFYAERRKCIK